MNILIFCIYSIPFFIVSLIHLIASQIDNEQLRSKTKPLLMPFLIFAVLLYSFINIKAFSIRHILLCCALFFSWIGDMYLLGKPSRLHFAKGAISFLIGHCLYFIILIFTYKFTYVSAKAAIIIIFLYSCMLFIVMKKNHLPRGRLGLLLVIYGIILCLNSCVSFIVLFTHFTATSANAMTMNSLILPYIFIIFFGSISFLISDTLLSFVTFIKHFKHCNYLVMFTYLLAEFLLTLGIIMC